MRRFNPERRKKMHARQFGSVDRVMAIKRLGCAVVGPGCDGPIDNSHVIPRGMGGVKGEWFHVVPLCRFTHHDMLDRMGPARFKEETGVDVIELARELAGRIGYDGRAP